MGGDAAGPPAFTASTALTQGFSAGLLLLTAMTSLFSSVTPGPCDPLLTSPNCADRVLSWAWPSLLVGVAESAVLVWMAFRANRGARVTWIHKAAFLQGTAILITTNITANASLMGYAQFTLPGGLSVLAAVLTILVVARVDARSLPESAKRRVVVSVYLAGVQTFVFLADAVAISLPPSPEQLPLLFIYVLASCAIAAYLSHYIRASARYGVRLLVEGSRPRSP